MYLYQIIRFYIKNQKFEKIIYFLFVGISIFKTKFWIAKFLYGMFSFIFPLKINIMQF